MLNTTLRTAAPVLALLVIPGLAHAQEADAAPTLETIQVTGSWLGSGLQDSVKNFAGGRTVLDRTGIEAAGATGIGDAMRGMPGVQSSESSATAGSAISLSIGIRGLTARYSPRSTVLLDGIPLAVAPYGQPQLSLAPVSLANIEAIDVVRGGGAVRYGPQNVGGIVNFSSRAIPTTPGLAGDATLRTNSYARGGHNEQYSAFIGSQLDNGLGLALLYSGMTGTDWRAGSREKVNDLALKFRYALDAHAEVYGKVSYFEVTSRTPGGLTVAQYNANPFQNTRPNDFWDGNRKAFDIGYRNTLSATQEFEVRTYYSDASRRSVMATNLATPAGTQLNYQPRSFETTGFEPRYTQRFTLGPTTQDVTAGYRYIRERGNDDSFVLPPLAPVPSLPPGSPGAFRNATDAHAFHIDDRIALGAWRITPGVRFEHISTRRDDVVTRQAAATANDKWLPSLSIAYLVNPALTLFGNYTTSFGPVQVSQLSPQAPTPLFPEVARTRELGARWKDAQFSAEVTVFNIRFDNQILQVPGSVPLAFQNIGATEHNGVESAVGYRFDRQGPLRGLDLRASYTYTKAIQQSGPTQGLDVPFYSRFTDSLGARYQIADWTFNLSGTHQSAQFTDGANTVAETPNGALGRVPGFRTWNAQATWKMPGSKGTEIQVGLNNITDRRYYTRNVDTNPGRMVGAPRMLYLQGRFAF